MDKQLLIITGLLFFGAGIWFSCETAEKEDVSIKIDLEGHDMAPARRHNMLVLGSDIIYLVILPDYDSPSPHIGIFQVNFEHKNANPNQIYRQDRQRTAEKNYYFVSDVFSMTELHNPPEGIPRRNVINGVLTRGSPDSGNTILKEVHAKISKVVMATEVESLAYPSDNRTYYVFGGDSELFAIKTPVVNHSFQHIFSLKVIDGVYHQNLAEAIKLGTLMNVRSDGTRPPRPRHKLVGDLIYDGKEFPIQALVLKDHYKR